MLRRGWFINGEGEYVVNESVHQIFLCFNVNHHSSACTSGSNIGWYYSSRSRFLCSDCSSTPYHYLSMRISFPSLFAAFLDLDHSASAGVIPKVNHSNRRSILYTMTMYVGVIYEIGWMWQYAGSISVFLVRIIVDSRLRCIATIMCSILSMQKS